MVRALKVAGIAFVTFGAFLGAWYPNHYHHSKVVVVFRNPPTTTTPPNECMIDGYRVGMSHEDMVRYGCVTIRSH